MQCYNCYENHLSRVKIRRKNTSNSGRSDKLDSALFQFWSTDEDKRLLNLFGKFGRNWKKISLELGRTNADCFQRYQILITLGSY
jgi:hypothetical protein